MKKKRIFFSLSFSLSLRLSPSPNKSLPHPTQTLKLNQGPSYNGLKTPHALGALTDRSQGTRFLLLFPPVFPPFLSRSLPPFFLSPTNNINNKHLPKTTQSKRRTQLQWSKDTPRSGRSHRPQPGNKVTLSSSLSPTFSICHSPKTFTRINKKNQTN